MKKLCIFALALLSAYTVKAQHQINSFFDELGVMRIETQELSQSGDTLVSLFHRSDDVIYSRVVYRIIDMRFKQNFQLYSPVAPDDPQYRSLFKVILDTIAGGLPVYEKSSEVGDIKPYFNLPQMERAMIPTILNTDRDGTLGDGNVATSEYMLLNYDANSGKMTFNSYSYKGFARNQLKYLIQEVIFFDRHYSRLFTKIMAIAPLQADNVNYYEDMPVMEALYGQILFWIPFDALRPCMAKQYMMPINNDSKRVTFEEFFAKKLYSSYLVGESDVHNRMIPDYAKTYEEIKREQDRIEWELLSAEQDLWEY